MPEAIEISWQVMTFDDSFDHKKTNLAFESTFYSFVELYPNGGKEDFLNRFGAFVITNKSMKTKRTSR